MKYGYFAAGACALALGTASPAGAVVNICLGGNCVPTDDNVLIVQGSSPAVGTYSFNSVTAGVAFTSGLDTLISPSNGQARIEAADAILNQVTFTVASGYAFSTALFNMNSLSGNSSGTSASAITLSYLDANGNLASQTVTGLNLSGQNFIGISGTAGERFTSVTITADPASSGFADLRQLRLGGVAATAAVPEPSTWLMMIAGFGLVGSVMRRPTVRTPRFAIN